MQEYYKSKQVLVTARPMTRLEYNILRNWKLPEDERGDDEGYIIIEEESKHMNWKPKQIFEDSYVSADEQDKTIEKLKIDTIGDFGWAIEAIKRGEKVCRSGWNGKKMFIFLAHPVEIEYKGKETCNAIDFADKMTDSICMMTAKGDICVGWLSSQADMLSEDWEIAL